MELRRLGLVGVIAVLVAVGLAWWMAPERGRDVGEPPRGDVAQRVSGAGAVERDRDRGATWDVRRGVPELEVRTVQPAPGIEIDPSEVLSADQQGIAGAALARRDRLVACWESYRPPDATRLTLRFTITDAGEGAGAVDVFAPALPDATALHACLNDAFSDARFVSPGEIAQTVVWPVPLPPWPEGGTGPR